MAIKYFNRNLQRVEKEKVYGGQLVDWIYGTASGRILSPLLAYGPLSGLYGKWQDSSMSKAAINPFIKEFSIKMDEFLPEEGANTKAPYSSFNQFFIRRFKPGMREFDTSAEALAAPCEARYFGLASDDESRSLPVKGKDLSRHGLLKNKLWDDVFEAGPVLIARLCPVDYHRFHFPDDGKILDQYNLEGALHSVNPMALKAKSDIFLTNERQVTIMETSHFGRLAYIEVGALCVGKIVQSFEGESFSRGQEKGYFLFGGSTVIVLGEKGVWSPSHDILEYSKKGIETYIQLGQPVAYPLDSIK